MEFFNQTGKLFKTILGLFLFLTLVVAILPAMKNQQSNKPLPGAPSLTEEEKAGKNIYIANGCVACHSQQVRNIEMDKAFGDRPSIAADYAGNTRTDLWRNTATLMGTERTGPDLTNIGNRQPSTDWHLLHLFQPRIVVDQSIMPAYPWLFEIREKTNKDDVEVKIPELYSQHIKGKVIATREALQLVAYLKSLKQQPLPDGRKAMDFLYPKAIPGSTAIKESPNQNGQQLYAQNCQSCHQANGEGLPGAFPALKGSPIVNGDNLELFVGIIMKGYDARPEYGTMPSIGINNNLTAEEITAIINHERSSWGNQAKPVSAAEVSRVMDMINTNNKK
ncbi:cytochrome c [Flavihumibacter rivuli]|uniref:cytochrome c n=1 Tax=Flavihumibacter rivuli TaxID=2838156 RepID=UPI001BDEB797|nr:cbb3-type cytochrome c oxidase subunit II [Flavihumibacter rivuli]ULQ58313.1 cytochrome c [Flavihumibacter rivuli]